MSSKSWGQMDFMSSNAFSCKMTLHFYDWKTSEAEVKLVTFCDVILKCDVISNKCDVFLLLGNDREMTVEFDCHFALIFVMPKSFQMTLSSRIQNNITNLKSIWPQHWKTGIRIFWWLGLAGGNSLGLQNHRGQTSNASQCSRSLKTRTLYLGWVDQVC